jgi:hypothetical protein
MQTFLDPFAARAGRTAHKANSTRNVQPVGLGHRFKIIRQATVEKAAAVLIEHGRDAAISWLVSEGVLAPAARVLVSLLAPTR